jgi:type I restriction-modification system DNA methylase subunit
MMDIGLASIKKVIQILDSVDYAHYSSGKVKTYLDYTSGTWADERILISPILFPRFFADVLGFKLGESIGAQEAISMSGTIPDYLPVDTRTHPFVFDCKSMDTDNLSKHHKQINSYIKAQTLQYGILTNMRDLTVYTLDEKYPIESLSFSFVQLYKDFHDLKEILDAENTKHYLEFVERFSFKPLTKDEKFKKVITAKPWTGNETVNTSLLTQRLHYIVSVIHEDVMGRKNELKFLENVDAERAERISQEIELIASEIDNEREAREGSVEAFNEALSSNPDSLLGRALDLFFYRAAYFAMTRLLIARAWEDIGFIDQSLYNGGLAKWYENFDKEIQRVLRYAFGLAAERYGWLFNIDNNYTWYEPSDELLVELLYEMSNFNLGKLNQDVLGAIYEEYIDKVDKKKKGQYYTPREIIEFIWNRVGFTRPEAYFNTSEGKRKPKLIFDPATGSGGFLVEAARRIREESKVNWNDFQDVLDVRTAILAGICGSEISIFPYYITEVNLLLQLTPAVKRMIELRRGITEDLSLRVVPVDSLSLYNPEATLIPEEDYKYDHVRELLPLEGQKKTIFRRIKKDLDGTFDYCCANPPYIGESGNKELFRSTLVRFPYWEEYYQGKMDYLYFFIILGLSKLRNGGKLGFITTEYWPTADGASKLRDYILKNAKIHEIIFFGDVNIFEYAKGQHDMVFVLEKCSGEDNAIKRKNSRIKVVRVTARNNEIPGSHVRDRLNFLTRHIELHVDKRKWEDEYIQVFNCLYKQGEPTEEAWGLLADESSGDAIKSIEAVGTTLKEFVSIDQGVVPSPLRLTKAKCEQLPQETIRKYNIKKGDGIFVITREELVGMGLPESEMCLIKPFYKNSDIGRYITADDTQNFLVYTNSSVDIKKFPGIKKHLEKFKSILEERLTRYDETYKWYELHRARDQENFEGEKIICSYRAKEASFAYHDSSFYGSTDMYFMKLLKADDEHSLKYVTAVLNSKVTNFWLLKKGKQKGEITEQFSTPLEKVYIPTIDFTNRKQKQIHDSIVELVDSMVKERNELSSYSPYFSTTNLGLISENAPLPNMCLEEILLAVAPEKRLSLRTHPGIRIDHGKNVKSKEFILKRTKLLEMKLEGCELEIISKDDKVIILKGSEELLKIVQAVLQGREKEYWEQLKELPLIPATVEDYDKKKSEILKDVESSREKIRQLQDSIDSLVCDLFGVTSEQVTSVRPEIVP